MAPHCVSLNLAELFMDDADDEDEHGHAEDGHSGQEHLPPPGLESLLGDELEMVNSPRVHLDAERLD